MNKLHKLQRRVERAAKARSRGLHIPGVPRVNGPDTDFTYEQDERRRTRLERRVRGHLDSTKVV